MRKYGLTRTTLGHVTHCGVTSTAPEDTFFVFANAERYWYWSLISKLSELRKHFLRNTAHWAGPDQATGDSSCTCCHPGAVYTCTAPTDVSRTFVHSVYTHKPDFPPPGPRAAEANEASDRLTAFWIFKAPYWSFVWASKMIISLTLRIEKCWWMYDFHVCLIHTFTF